MFILKQIKINLNEFALLNRTIEFFKKFNFLKEEVFKAAMRIGVSLIGVAPVKRKKMLNGRFFIFDIAKNDPDVNRFMSLLKCMINDGANSLSRSIIVVPNN